MTILPEITQAEVDERVGELVDDLTAARHIMADCGHVKKKFGLKDNQPVCVVGAVLRAVGIRTTGFEQYTTPRVDRAIFALATTLGKPEGDSFDRRGHLYSFNDSELTTPADALGLFDTTIQNLTS
jgi:hypothetical protein